MPSAAANPTAKYDPTADLERAITISKVEAVKKALQHGANLQFQPAPGVSLLMRACETKHTEIVRMLLEAGAELDVVSNEGYTALLVAAAAGNVETAQCLLNAGANVLLGSPERWYDAIDALLSSSKAEQRELARQIMSRGCGLSAETARRDGLSLLDWAVRENNGARIALIHECTEARRRADFSRDVTAVVQPILELLDARVIELFRRVEALGERLSRVEERVGHARPQAQPQPQQFH
eukprot:tig00021038_g17515.t1